MSRTAGLILACALASAVFFADYALKRAVENSTRLYESFPLLPGVANLTHVKNPGGAFGILDGRGGLLLLGSAVALAFVLWVLIAGPPSRATSFGCGLVLGGAAGNLLDRLTTGEVTDYLDLQFWPLERWPVFNAADVAIVVGVAVLLLAALRPEKATRQPAANEREKTEA